MLCEAYYYLNQLPVFNNQKRPKSLRYSFMTKILLMLKNIVCEISGVQSIPQKVSHVIVGV